MFEYFIMLSPAILLGMWAQMRVRSAYASASQQPAPLTGAAAARHLLDSAGLQQVAIEAVRGQMTDHYDPRTKVLRLSEGVYGQRTMAAVGIAAHEAGHAIQDAERYTPLVLRNIAVPAASFGGSAGIWVLVAGSLFGSPALVLVGVVAFAAVAAFQLINLPVEFDASNRAKRQLVEAGIVPQQSMGAVNGVLNAAAWTYVAATLSAVLTLIYLLRIFGGSRE